MTYQILLFLHVIGACVLLGTGAGIAFFMVIANRSRDPALIAHTAGTVVLADTLFTATAAIIQPITGYLLMREAGWTFGDPWILIALALYVVVGAFWLPVVWIQMRLRKLAQQAADTGSALPPAYDRLYRIWFACGFPAFAAMLAIIWIMIAKPGF